LLGGHPRPPDRLGPRPPPLAPAPAPRPGPPLGHHHVPTVALPRGRRFAGRPRTPGHRPQQPGLFWVIDGKPLPIGGCSKDRQAGYGKAAGAKAKGYKLHALVGSDGSVANWRVAPMNKDERVMAERLVKGAPPEVAGYLLGDANFDSNPLHQVC